MSMKNFNLILIKNSQNKKIAFQMVYLLVTLLTKIKFSKKRNKI